MEHGKRGRLCARQQRSFPAKKRPNRRPGFRSCARERHSTCFPSGGGRNSAHSDRYIIRRRERACRNKWEPIDRLKNSTSTVGREEERYIHAQFHQNNSLVDRNL